MIPAVAILIFAWSLKGMGDALGIGVFVENLVGTNASASVILPAVMFMIAIFLAFSTGTSWGNLCDPGADRSSDVPGTEKSGNDDHLCGGSSGRSSMRRSHFSNLRYNSNVFCGCTEQSHQSCIHSDAVCHGRGGSLYRRISDRRNREDLVGCTGQQSFDLVCSTDGFEETRAEKGCGGTACVM